MAGTRADSLRLLIKYGYLTKAGKEKFPELDGTRLEDVKLKTRRQQIRKQLDEMSEANLDKYADQHEVEMTAWQMHKTMYPTPNVMQGDHYPDPMTYRVVWETFQRPIESFYFFLVDQFRDLGFRVEKITDVFAASEQSSFYGVQQQRIGLHQDKVAQFLRGISELVRQLFQITREIRIIKERLQYYKDAKSPQSRKFEPAEIALKGLYVDLVEGGAKNAASVFGMSRELQFTTLPDLFFSIHPKTLDTINETVDKLQFNKKVKEVLKRKLYAYMNWKNSTEGELAQRHVHTLKYLRQHYDVIQLYLTWIKPYLKQVTRLTQDSRKLESPDMVAAFEGSIIELELIGRFFPTGNTKYAATIVVNALYRTSPTMPFSNDFQRGPLHQGKIDIVWRYYVWSDEDAIRYKEMREEEGFQLLSSIDESVKASMDALGDELQSYLKEAGKEFEEKLPEEEIPPADNILEIMKAPFKGFGESFGALIPKGTFKIGDPGRRKKREQAVIDAKEIKIATRAAAGLGWLHFRNFKKGHGLVTW